MYATNPQPATNCLTLTTPPALNVLYALEMKNGKLICMRTSGDRKTINAGMYGAAIAFTSAESLNVFRAQHRRNSIVRATTMISLSPVQLIDRREYWVHLILDGECLEIRVENALAYAELTPAERKTGYGYDVRFGNRRAA